MLTAHRLSCSRNNQRLFSNLELSLSAGEILHIVGANGSGKSSLLQLLLGLMRPDEGEVKWQGRAISDAENNYHAQVCYIGHKIGVKSNLTVLENLRLAAKLAGSNQPLHWPDILQRLNLSEQQNILSQNLSAGQRQRIALGRLLISSAILWILDEPFTALDKDSIALLQTLLLEHVARGGMVILTSHHDLDLPHHAVKRLELAA